MSWNCREGWMSCRTVYIFMWNADANTNLVIQLLSCRGADMTTTTTNKQTLLVVRWIDTVRLRLVFLSLRFCDTRNVMSTVSVTLDERTCWWVMQSVTDRWQVRSAIRHLNSTVNPIRLTLDTPIVWPWIVDVTTSGMCRIWRFQSAFSEQFLY